MSLEVLVDRLNDSKNREFANRIFAQMDIIDAGYEELEKIKHSHKVNFEKKSLPLITQRETFIALNIGFSKDHREKIRDYRLETKAKIKEIKSDSKIELKQLKSELKKFEERLDDYYNHHKKEYLLAIERNVPNAQAKLDKFEKDYVEFRSEQVEEMKRKNEEAINNLIENCNKEVSRLENELKTFIDNENLEHKKLKEQRFIENNKIEIKKINKEIKELRKASFEERRKNSDEIKACRNKYYEIKKKASLEIESIKKEKEVYASKLSASELADHKNFEKLIQQEIVARKKRVFSERFKKKTAKVNPAYLFVAPAFLGALVMTIFPFCFMLIAAWFKLDLVNLENSVFVGFRNFVNIFTKDTEFQKSLGNTAIYALVTFGLLTVVTVLMAAWLSKNTKIHNAAQTMIFTPHIASLVSISIVWIALLNPTGIINQILAVFGIEGPGWLIQENTSLISVSFVQVWKDIGYYVLIIISGLQGIPTYVYEAAKLDKASKATTFFKVTLPLLTPTLSFVFVTKFINSFKVFAPIEIMTNGGPMGSSMVLSYWIYKVGRVGYNYGNAMAGAIVLTIIVGVCTALNYRFFANRGKK